MLRAISFLHGVMKRRTQIVSEIPEHRWGRFQEARFLVGHITLLVLIMILVSARLLFGFSDAAQEDVF